MRKLLIIAIAILILQPLAAQDSKKLYDVVENPERHDIKFRKIILKPWDPDSEEFRDHKSFLGPKYIDFKGDTVEMNYVGSEYKLKFTTGVVSFKSDICNITFFKSQYNKRFVKNLYYKNYNSYGIEFSAKKGSNAAYDKIILEDNGVVRSDMPYITNLSSILVVKGGQIKRYFIYGQTMFDIEFSENNDNIVYQ
jgi:hypothetical protein